MVAMVCGELNCGGPCGILHGSRKEPKKCTKRLGLGDSWPQQQWTIDNLWVILSLPFLLSTLFHHCYYDPCLLLTYANKSTYDLIQLCVKEFCVMGRGVTTHHLAQLPSTSYSRSTFLRHFIGHLILLKEHFECVTIMISKDNCIHCYLWIR